MISRIFTRSITSASRFTSLKPQGAFNFSERSWKDRDQAAEKVFITQAQKQAMKRLLQKMNEQDADSTAKMEVFERKLEEILNKYKVNNEAFRIEVLHLHKEL